MRAIKLSYQAGISEIPSYWLQGLHAAEELLAVSVGPDLVASFSGSGQGENICMSPCKELAVLTGSSLRRSSGQKAKKPNK